MVMEERLNKQSILKKTAHVGILSIISKILGIIREIMQIHFLGVSTVSDAFSVAFRLPNSLRKIFAEGALSAAVIPTLVGVIKDKPVDHMDRLMSLLTLVITNLILLTALLVYIFAPELIILSAPGFISRPEQLEEAIKLLRILIFFLVFISIGSLFASALQAKKKFIIPAMGPIIINIIYVLGLLICTKYNFSVYTFSFFILFGGLIQLSIYILSYFKLKYQFLTPNRETFQYLKQILKKFIPSLITNGILEINLYMDMGFASFLKPGSITLINLASRFMGIILSAFAGALSSVLLSHLSQITVYSPKKLSFYVLEVAKLVLWITLPATLLMVFFSYDIFYTLFYKFSSKFDIASVAESSILLSIFSSCLFFFSLNKILISIYYSIHKTIIPTIIALFGAFFNLIFNWYFIRYWGVIAIAISTSLSSILQTILLLSSLYLLADFVIYINKFYKFLFLYIIQMVFASTIFYIIYILIKYIISFLLIKHQDFLLYSLGLWIWIGPLSLLIYGLLYKTRKIFGIKLYFLD